MITHFFRYRENFVIFTGGLTADRAGKTPSLTVIHGKTTTVLEMEHNVLDFIPVCESQWESGKGFALLKLV